jgi:Integrase zinc binding domain
MEALFARQTLIIKTDHISLKHLLEQRLTHTIQHKGLCKLLGLDYTIQYKKGVENKAADALPRLTIREEEGEVIAVTEILPTWLEELKESYTHDEWAKAVLDNVESINKSKEDGSWSVHARIIRRKGRVYVGEGMGWRGKIVQTFHDTSMGGHSGILGTYQRVKKLFYWPKLR